jgi:hypothetical protein
MRGNDKILFHAFLMGKKAFEDRKLREIKKRQIAVELQPAS